MPDLIKKVNNHKKKIEEIMNLNKTNYDNILEYQPKIDIMMANV